MEAETQLPLTNPANCIQVDNVLDLSKSYFVFYIRIKYSFIQTLKLINFLYRQ